MREMINDELVKVFETSEISMTAIIRSLLDVENIEYFMTGEHMQSLFGAEFIFAPGVDVGKVEFFVHRDDEKTALEILTQNES